MNIRTFKEEDWERINEIHNLAREYELLNSNIPYTYICLKNLYKENSSIDYKIYVYEVNNYILGFIAISKNRINWLYVDPNFYRKGIASSLLSYVLNIFNSDVYITVLTSNSPAIYLYRKFGFEIIEKQFGELINEDKVFISMYIMKYKKPIL